MQTVENIDDIIANCMTLYRYLTSNDHRQSDYAKDRIGRGICYFRIVIDGSSCFFPSRFIGYKDNSIENHDNNHNKHGQIANNYISKVTSSQPIAGIHDEEFKNFCIRYNIKYSARGSFGNLRKYWPENSNESSERQERLAEDIERIINSTETDETTKLSLIEARIGQSKFRKKLLKEFGHCAATGCKIDTLLRASHIKPWRVSTNVERMDPNNGIMLAVNWDAAFDAGLITFSDSGDVFFSEALDKETRATLGLNENIKVKGLERRKDYLKYHREIHFKGHLTSNFNGID